MNNKLLIETPSLTINDKDRIGLVGRNGSGKTTLLNILSGYSQPDRGTIKIFTSTQLLCQIEKEFSSLSGGETTQKKITEAFTKNTGLLFLDEPTNHLNMKNIDYLKKLYYQFQGAIITVSHNRDFLNNVCNKIWEIENNKLTIYEGNYHAYTLVKTQQKAYEEKAYLAFLNERQKLKEMIQYNKEKTNKVKKTPSRMGNSEARLHKMYSSRAKSKLGNKIADLENKLSQLEIKDKPKEMKTIKIPLPVGRTLFHRTIIEGKDLNWGFGEKEVLKNLLFSLKNNSKTALIGENGSGRTTLLKAILKNNTAVTKRKNVSIGYFSQQFDSLDLNKTVLESILATTIFDETITRRILDNLLFTEDDLKKKVFQLSGGEKNKLSIGILLTKDINVLLLDEPTNHLDIPSIEALEKALKNYSGTLLFATHDKQLVENIATDIWILDKGQLKINGKPNVNYSKKDMNLLKKKKTKNCYLKID